MGHCGHIGRKLVGAFVSLYSSFSAYSACAKERGRGANESGPSRKCAKYLKQSSNCFSLHLRLILLVPKRGTSQMRPRRSGEICGILVRAFVSLGWEICEISGETSGLFCPPPKSRSWQMGMGRCGQISQIPVGAFVWLYSSFSAYSACAKEREQDADENGPLRKYAKKTGCEPHTRTREWEVICQIPKVACAPFPPSFSASCAHAE